MMNISAKTDSQSVSATRGSDRFVPSGATFFELDHSPEPRDYYFILMPNMTMLAFSSAIEPLRFANQLTGKCLYRWHLLSEDGNPVTCSNGISIAVDSALCDVRRQDIIFVCSGHNGYQAANASTLNLLRLHHRRGGQVGGICTGAYSLARAGLLHGRTFTLHWENQPAFAERFPELEISSRLFENDDRIQTCSGGAAVTDMMLATIEKDHGSDLTRMVTEMCVHGVKRSAEVDQQSSFAAAISSRNQRLIGVVKRMQENIEDRISFDELSVLEDISKRQMERLFMRYLGTSPSQYYKNIRLDHGRRLICETNMSVTEISVACGFSTQATFSKSYKSRFGERPSKTHVQNC